ncbi:MAG TPA: hypothetical protein VKZ98_08960, partial [Aquaticitalea sp.]|nr:hypothetical protein [Aquaticitalea sp.]
KKERAREFAIHGDRLVALIGNSLSVYNTVEPYFNRDQAIFDKDSKGTKDLQAQVTGIGH